VFAATKFQAPPARAEHVRRARLLNAVSGPLAPRHLLISAPAGFGKSTLATQWAEGFPRATWISLSAEDDEPGQFWDAFIVAVQKVIPHFGRSEREVLLGGGDVRAVLVRLLDQLAQETEELAVVFDDLHVITDPDCHDGLDYLLRRAPPSLHLCLCTRHDPPLNLERAVVHGELAVVRGADLLFDEQEANEFLLERLQLGLSPDEARALAEETEGWAAGLYLAALAVRAGGPQARHRRVRDYLSSEVLESATVQDLRLLEDLALFDRFSGPMLDHVLQTEDSARHLEELEQSNLFVIPLDATGTWFRLHHLIADLLRERLEAHDPDRAPRLQARAADWHLAHGDIPEAIQARLRAGQFEAAADLIARHHAVYLNQSRLGATVARWLDRLPPQLVAGDPQLALDRAWVAGMNGRQEEMEYWLELATELPGNGPLPDGSASAEAQAAVIAGCFSTRDFRVRLERAREAALLDRPGSPWYALAHAATGLWGYLVDGPTEEVLHALAVASRNANAPEQAVTAAFAPAIEAAVFADTGQRAHAEAAIRAADRARQRFEIERVPQASVAWWATAYAHLSLGHLAEAAADAAAGVAASYDLPPEHDAVAWAPANLIQLARVHVALGEYEPARKALAEARERLDLFDYPGRLAGWLEDAELAVSTSGAAPAAAEDLSERELAVLALMAQPLTLRQIGGRLHISYNTVKSHARSIYAKLGAASRAEAVDRARRLGLVTE
jgi:LuxR family maltose regulon positive regulatory protein